LQREQSGWICRVAIHCRTWARHTDNYFARDGHKALSPFIIETPALPSSAREKTWVLIAAAVTGRSANEPVTTLESAGVWVEPCRKDAEQEVLNDPRFIARGTVQITHHPLYGEVRDIRALFNFPRSKSARPRQSTALANTAARYRARLDSRIVKYSNSPPRAY